MPSALTKLLGRIVWSLSMVLATSALVYFILRSAQGAESSMPGFLEWLRGALLGDLGESSTYRPGESVTVLLAGAAGESLFVVGFAVLFSFTGAMLLTYLWSGAPRPRLSPFSRAAAYVLSASPVFLLSYWAVRGMNVASMRGLLHDRDWIVAPLSITSAKYWLAAATLAVGNGMLMESARGFNTEVRRILESDFILFARARGRPLWRHLGLAMVAPLTSATVNRLTAIFGGAIIVEKIFSIPGLGSLTWEAASQRDSRLLLAAATAWALAYALCHIAGDAVAAAVDPRLRTASVEEQK